MPLFPFILCDVFNIQIKEENGNAKEEKLKIQLDQCGVMRSNQ